MSRQGSRPTAESGPPEVALVSTPFHRCLMPPIGLGILKTALADAGIASRVYNFNLDLLPELDPSAARAVELYEWFCDRLPGALMGEWLFAPPSPETDERYLALLSECGFEEEHLSLLRRLRGRVDGLIARWARRLVEGHHDVVGLSFSLGRTRANVRLAEAVRRLAPSVRILAGGFEVSGDMGCALLEAFPVLDLVCHAEADELVVPIVHALRGDSQFAIEQVRGISYRRGEGIVVQRDGSQKPEIERTPRPDYDDYFEEVDGLRAAWDEQLALPSYLPVETARGCWWGERQHCIFCSVNGDRIHYISKSADRVLADLDALHERYGVKRFLVVDNVLDNRYFKTLLPRLADASRGYQLEWEVRPDLGRAKVEALARAGVAWVQPGVESLSTPALRTMNKGTTAIENVQAMKWLMAYGIQCSWNFLYSLPGEQLEWYEEVAPLIARLQHLDPPRGPHRIGVERFSPYVSEAQEMGVRILGPSLFSRLAFHDVSDELLGRFAYDFDYELSDRPPELDARIVGILVPLLTRWRESFEAHGCTLSWVDGPGESLLVEGPLLEPDRILRVRGLLRRFLAGCESIQPESRLLKRLQNGPMPERDPGRELDPKDYRKVLRELCFTGVRPEDAPEVTTADVLTVADERGWIYRESGRIISLPVDQNRLVQSRPFQLEAALRRYR